MRLAGAEGYRSNEETEGFVVRSFAEQNSVSSRSKRMVQSPFSKGSGTVPHFFAFFRYDFSLTLAIVTLLWYNQNIGVRRMPCGVGHGKEFFIDIIMPSARQLSSLYDKTNQLK